MFWPASLCLATRVPSLPRELTSARRLTVSLQSSAARARHHRPSALARLLPLQHSDRTPVSRCAAQLVLARAALQIAGAMATGAERGVHFAAQRESSAAEMEQYPSAATGLPAYQGRDGKVAATLEDIVSGFDVRPPVCTTFLSLRVQGACTWARAPPLRRRRHASAGTGPQLQHRPKPCAAADRAERPASCDPQRSEC